MATKRPLDRDLSRPEKLPDVSIVEALGPDSAPFRAAMACWEPLLETARGTAALHAWQELLAEYSSKPPDRELFLRHTYMSSVARCGAAAAITGNLECLSDGELCQIARGDWFGRQGIEGFEPERSLFAWVDSPAALRGMARALDSVNLPGIHADLLKLLHHSLTSLDSRRSLGELYTPDWLTAWIVEDVLRDGPGGPILDPACGSGTFLFHAIRRLAARMPCTAPVLEQIVAEVHGADVNPVAVEMARANVLLALGPLLPLRTGPIRPRIELRDVLSGRTWPGRFGLIIGNPPWTPLRAAPAARQTRLKQIAAEVGLADERAEMTTHLETALLFLAHCADSALEAGGRIAFVTPRTVFSAAQHHRLRTGALNLRVERVMDCERVSPLFNTPAAVLFCRKQESDSRADIPVLNLSGRLPERDCPLPVARNCLAESTGLLRLHQASGRSWWGEASSPQDTAKRTGSPYKARFRQGATLVPRSFWFVDVEDRVEDCRVPTRIVRSSVPGKGGPVAAYRDYQFQGPVEERFLFRTVLGDDLLPFAARRYRVVALPAEMDSAGKGGLRLAGVRQLADSGCPGMAFWLAEAERIWAHERGEKADRMSLLQRLDHVRGLTAQRPAARWRVLYPNFQRASVACVIENSPPSDGAETMGFVADTALYCCEAEDEWEARYLCAVLNSRLIDAALGPLRRGDQAAHPNVHKKTFDVAPIPIFDSTDSRHLSLASLSKACAMRVESLLAADSDLATSRIGPARGAVRIALASELAEIDALTLELLGRPLSSP